ncbi:MAG: hypothetical protein CVV18_00675 [Gammaproteobacteria bacterium HGW-Gammaproteobacteria-8]|nr:MAG: hypothetical protein CVV18_00675 [Gammaproteobacteria bacterium HGW-Gammaproteobacteria-8]
MRTFTSFAIGLTIVFASLVLGGCGEGEVPISNDRLIESFEQGRSGIWVSAEAEVSELLSDQGIGGKSHQRFTIAPNNELVVQIRHSVDDAERVPVQPGDTVRVQGYYQWDARGGFISRTFSAPSEPGGGGWIEHKGKRYD